MLLISTPLLRISVSRSDYPDYTFPREESVNATGGRTLQLFNSIPDERDNSRPIAAEIPEALDGPGLGCVHPPSSE